MENANVPDMSESELESDDSFVFGTLTPEGELHRRDFNRRYVDLVKRGVVESGGPELVGVVYEGVKAIGLAIAKKRMGRCRNS